MTVPFAGRSWTLADPIQDGVGAPANGPGAQGQFTATPGKLGYNEVFAINYSLKQCFNRLNKVVNLTNVN